MLDSIRYDLLADAARDSAATSSLENVRIREQHSETHFRALAERSRTVEATRERARLEKCGAG